jgi:oligoendopeptidase F
VDELEMLLDEVIHFTEFDYRYRKLKEYAELCDSQAQDITDWMDMYESLRERLETTKQQLKDENEEIRRKHAKTVAGIADKVEGLATDCDKRLQELEQRDCLAKGMSFIERIKIFFQMKLGLIPISEYRQMELEIFKVSDELKELKRNI